MPKIKKLFSHYLQQLQEIVSLLPEELLSCSLADDMFSLEMHAKIAANFSLRGYCPLLDSKVVSFFQETPGLDALNQQISDTLTYLNAAAEIIEFDDNKQLSDKAGDAEITLPQSEFIHLYIVPNFLFHISMVYAIARANGIALSKGNFDGFHSYSPGFRFASQGNK